MEEKDVTIEAVKLECLLLIPTTTAAIAPPENPPPPKKVQGLAAVLLNIYSEPNDRQTLLTSQQRVASYQNFPKTTPETDPLVW